FSEALTITPQDQQLYYYAGYSADMLDNFKGAQAIYEQGLAKFPEYSVLRKRLVYHYITSDSYDKAIATLAPIDEMERDVQYYLLLSSAYDGKKDDKRAISTLQEGIQVHTYNAALFMSLAAKYEKLGRYDDSINLLEQALKYEPESAEIQNFLGYMLADLNRNLDRAFTLISSALKQEPDNYAYIDSLAWVHFRRGEFKKARDLMVRALKINPKDEELIDHMQQIEKALGK
ncbi:MAG: tetratricopeptide repeat protein, partial [Deferribacteraceae bacterium]|nr:tetratricopeptide repeat protein [Deferribacteraceae bacterium]